MNYPQFIDIDGSSQEYDQYPTEIAWSLPDGTIKSVLIQPDDDWDPWDACDADLDVQHFMDHGETPGDIIKELNEDVSGQTIFVDGLDEDQLLIDKLFMPCDPAEPDFEIATLKALFEGLDTETLLDSLDQISAHHGLDSARPEDRVRALLFLYAELKA